jgi:hypothetical protein
MWVHNILALSATFGLPAVWVAVAAGRLDNAVVFSMAMAATVLMHLSETKHVLDPGPAWRPWSTWFLNMHRAVAVLTATWIAVPLLQLVRTSPPFIRLAFVLCGLIGVYCMIRGEQRWVHWVWATTDPTDGPAESPWDWNAYVFDHLRWHYFAFAAMLLVANQPSAFHYLV